MAEKTDSLIAAAQYVAEAKKILARQRLRVAKLKALGASTLDAEHTLEVYESTLKLLEEHEATVRKLSRSSTIPRRATPPA